MKRMTGILAMALLILFDSFSTAHAHEDAQDIERAPANSHANPALSPEDQRTLRRGEIVEGRYIAGGVVGSIVGFGIGHAIQGRYRDNGWIFTVTEGVSAAVYMVGAISYLGDTIDGKRDPNSTGARMLAIGGLSWLGLHVWEIVDLWVTPPKLNERYRELRHQSGSRTSSDWHVFPTIVGEEKAPGLGLTATF